MSTTATATVETFNVWVGCLACYNNGRLVGEWAPAAEAPTTAAEFHALVGARALRASGHYIDSNPHEELWVFDHENSPVDGEYGTTAAREYAEWTADLQDDEQAPLRDWLSNEGEELQADSVERFREDYKGEHESAVEYVEGLYEGEELPSWAASHRGAVIAGIARDMRLNGEFWEAGAPGGRTRIFTAS